MVRQSVFGAPIIFFAVPTLVVAVGGLPACTSSGAIAGVDASVPAVDGATPLVDAATPLDGGACAAHLPAGFTQVTSSTTDPEFGAQVSMALDENDDPMFAYLVFGAGGAATLNFVRWNPCTGAFTAPEVVDNILGVSNNSGDREVSLAYDPTTKEIGVAYQNIIPDPGLNNAGTIWLATRKPGTAGFTTQMVSSGEHGDINSTSTPSLAMNAGKIYVAYAQSNYLCCASCGGCEGVWFLSSSTTPPVIDAGAEDAGPFDAGPPPPHYFNATLVPYSDETAYPSAVYGGIAQARTNSISLAIDSSGVPAVAFYEAPATGYNTSLLYWSSAMTGAVKVTDTNNVQNDDVDVTLRFEGTSPRVAGHVVSDATATYDLTFVASSDTGKTWGTPVRLPRDGDSNTALTSSLAVDGAGNAAIGAETNGGSGNNTCNNPYLALSTNDGVAWSACGADTAKAHTYVVGSITAAYGASRLKGTLALGFQNASIQGNQAGVIYWQKP